MKLELMQEGEHCVGRNQKTKAAQKGKKNLWEGKFNRRKKPREEDMMIDVPLATFGLKDIAAKE